MYFLFSEGKKSSRQEILHNIEPMSRPIGKRLKSSAFDNRIMAALRQGDWKLLTGNPGKIDGNFKNKIKRNSISRLNFKNS